MTSIADSSKIGLLTLRLKRILKQFHMQLCYCTVRNVGAIMAGKERLLLMRTSRFKAMQKSKRRVRFLGIVNSKINGRISRDTLESIIKRLDINKQYAISICSNAKDFAKAITLKDNEKIHSFDGRECIKEKGNVLFGNVNFGLDYYYEYFDNGDSTGIDTREILPCFNPKNIAVVSIDTYDLATWEKNSRQQENHRYRLIFYIPDNYRTFTEK